LPLEALDRVRSGFLLTNGGIGEGSDKVVGSSMLGDNGSSVGVGRSVTDGSGESGQGFVSGVFGGVEFWFSKYCLM